MRNRAKPILGLVLCIFLIPITSSADVAEDPFGCDLPVPDAYFSSSQPNSYGPFVRRDLANQGCSLQRVQDQLNPAYGKKMQQVAPQAYVEGISSQATEATRPKITASRLLPGASVADPFRTAGEWQSSGRGRVIPVRFVATKTGAHLAGDIWLPPSSVVGPYPGVIIATGTSQQFRQQYNWAAQGLAESGYQVLTFDFQGQGGSENLDHYADGAVCTTTTCLSHLAPPEQFFLYERFYDQVRDAIRFFFSTSTSPYGASTGNYVGTSPFNPAWASLDTARVGIAGHSVGAIAANDVGQEDQRIKAIVRWGYTGYVSDAYKANVHAPTLIMNSDYGSRGPEPFVALPAPGVPELGYNQLRSLSPQVDVMLLSLRASTHHEWAYVTGRPASRFGERVSLYYALAWFDAYLKGSTDSNTRTSAISRLIAERFDGSADRSSIGAGTYSLASGTNVPYLIEGHAACSRISYMYKSAYWLQGGAKSKADMRIGCGYSL